MRYIVLCLCFFSTFCFAGSNSVVVGNYIYTVTDDGYIFQETANVKLLNTRYIHAEDPGGAGLDVNIGDGGVIITSNKYKSLNSGFYHSVVLYDKFEGFSSPCKNDPSWISTTCEISGVMKIWGEKGLDIWFVVFNASSGEVSLTPGRNGMNGVYMKTKMTLSEFIKMLM